MKLTKPAFALLLVFCCASCLRKTPVNLWFYTHSINNNVDDSLLTPASFINLERDGSYTSDLGSFDYGTWVMRDDTLFLTNTDHVITSHPVKHLGAKELQLITGKDITANFDAQPFLPKGAVNPYSLSNNRWRIRASHKESEEEIRNRLINHCQFWSAYFTWAHENQFDVVDVRSTPTLIKIYGNGFSLKPFEDLPLAWRSYFFDAEDCKVANNLMSEAFQFHEVSWAHTDNKYKMFIGAFQQVKKFLQ